VLRLSVRLQVWLTFVWWWAGLEAVEGAVGTVLAVSLTVLLLSALGSTDYLQLERPKGFEPSTDRIQN